MKNRSDNISLPSALFSQIRIYFASLGYVFFTLFFFRFYCAFSHFVFRILCYCALSQFGLCVVCLFIYTTIDEYMRIVSLRRIVPGSTGLIYEAMRDIPKTDENYNNKQVHKTNKNSNEKNEKNNDTPI